MIKLKMENYNTILIENQLNYQLYNQVKFINMNILLVKKIIINNKINRLHERCLRLLYGDEQLSFRKLLEQDKSVTIHTRNLQILATEMLKVYRNIFPPIFSEIFHRRDINYNLRINSDFAMSNVRSVSIEVKAFRTQFLIYGILYHQS